MKQTNYTIVILGGLLKKKPDNTWRTADFNYLRVLAGYYLYWDMKKNNTVKLIVSGGKGIYEKIPGVPAVATVMKKELVKLGLLSKEIIVENKTASTYQELLWIKKLLNKNNDKITVISNGYHLPRIKTMLEVLPEFKKLRKCLKLVSAEKVVLKHNKRLRSKIGKMARDPRMIKIVSLEKRGVKDLRSGKYKLR